MTDLTFFDITIPLARLNEDGGRDTCNVTVHIPSADLASASEAAAEMAWVIVENLRDDRANPRGWKIARGGVSAVRAS
jgi:hypothetical protein